MTCNIYFKANINESILETIGVYTEFRKYVPTERFVWGYVQITIRLILYYIIDGVEYLDKADKVELRLQLMFISLSQCELGLLISHPFRKRVLHLYFENRFNY